MEVGHLLHRLVRRTIVHNIPKVRHVCGRQGPLLVWWVSGKAAGSRICSEFPCHVPSPDPRQTSKHLTCGMSGEASSVSAARVASEISRLHDTIQEGLARDEAVHDKLEALVTVLKRRTLTSADASQGDSVAVVGTDTTSHGAGGERERLRLGEEGGLPSVFQSLIHSSPHSLHPPSLQYTLPPSRTHCPNTSHSYLHSSIPKYVPSNWNSKEPTSCCNRTASWSRRSPGCVLSSRR
jgi:hypothetical protein